MSNPIVADLTHGSPPAQTGSLRPGGLESRPQHQKRTLATFAEHERLLSTAEIGPGEFHNLIATPVNDRLQEIEAEPLGLLHLDLRRHGQFLLGRDDVHQHWAGLRQRIA